MNHLDMIVYTSVLIDILRNYEPAISWLKENSNKRFGLNGFTIFEIYEGARNKAEINHLKKKLSEYPVFWPSENDFNNSQDMFTEFKLSHGLGVIDILIAQTAIGLDLPLYTMNKKHFEPINELKVVIPY